MWVLNKHDAASPQKPIIALGNNVKLPNPHISQNQTQGLIDIQTLTPFIEVYIAVNSALVSDEYLTLKNQLNDPKNLAKLSQKQAQQTIEMKQNQLNALLNNSTVKKLIRLNGGNSNDNLISFTTKDSFGSVSNIGSFKFYDKTMIQLQALISMSSNIVYRFGYYTSTGKMTEYMSDFYWGQVIDWKMDINVNGADHDISIGGLGISLNAYPPTPTIHKENRISDIAIKLAKKNDWGYEVEQTKIFDNKEFPDQLDSQNVGFLQRNESDVQFLHRLLPYCIGEKVSDPFFCYLREDVKDGKVYPTLVFRPLIVLKDRPKRIYTIYRSQVGIDPRQFDKSAIGIRGVALNFSPQMLPRAALEGQVGITARSVTLDDKGEINNIELTAKDQVISNKTGSGVKTIPNPTDIKSVFLTDQTYDNKDLSQNYLNYFKTVGYMATMQAKLTVVGDFNIKLGDTIYIEVLLPNSSQRHFTTGFYIVLAVEHTINAGDFTTNLELGKLGIDFGDAQLFQ